MNLDGAPVGRRFVCPRDTEPRENLSDRIVIFNIVGMTILSQSCQQGSRVIAFCVVSNAVGIQMSGLCNPRSANTNIISGDEDSSSSTLETTLPDHDLNSFQSDLMLKERTVTGYYAFL